MNAHAEDCTYMCSHVDWFARFVLDTCCQCEGLRLLTNDTQPPSRTAGSLEEILVQVSQPLHHRLRVFLSSNGCALIRIHGKKYLVLSAGDDTRLNARSK